MAIVLVTGGCGFIARGIVRRLHDDGHRVRVIDSLDERVHHGQMPTPVNGVDYRIKPVSHVTYEDVRDVQVLVHLAAQVSVADSHRDPLRYMVENTLQTTVLYAMMREHAKAWRRTVVASSMSVYGDGGTLVTEDSGVRPASVYGLSKYDQERLTLLLAPKPCALRFFNVYGPGQALDNPYTGVLANFARRLLDDKPPIVFEDGLQTRDFIFVDDVVDAVLTMVDHSPVEGVFNVCTGQPTTVLDAARQLAVALGKDIVPVVTGETRPGDIRHCTGDPGNINLNTGWRATVPFSEGVRRYATWLKGQV